MAGVPLMVVDGAGVMLRWSSQAETLLGRPADEVVGRSVTSLLSRLADATAPATGPLPEEMVLHDASGRVATGDLRVRPLLRHDGVAGLTDGPPLGSAEGPPFAQGTLPLAESSVLAFHTNSLLPGSRAVLPGDPGPLGQGLTASGRPLEEICHDVLYRLHDHPRPGDRVLLLARTYGLAADHVGTWHLDHHRSAAGTARTCSTPAQRMGSGRRHRLRHRSDRQ